jgi:IS6 family transposase
LHAPSNRSGEKGIVPGIEGVCGELLISPESAIRHTQVQYLNNILEQDHRAIKRRVKAKQSFREFRAARRAIEGYEAMHMIRKGQARWVSDHDVRKQNQFIDQLFDLAA